MYVCVCKAVTEHQIEQAVAEGVCTMPGLRLKLGVATCCCKCAPTAKSTLLRELAGASGETGELQPAVNSVRRWESSA